MGKCSNWLVVLSRGVLADSLDVMRLFDMRYLYV